MPDLADSITTPPASASPVAPGTLAKGVPFDPARHIPRTNPKTGAWMPKGGRKSKSAAPSSGSTSSQPEFMAPAASANSSPSPADSPAAQTVKADDLIPLADAPAPKAPAPGSEKTADTAPAPIPEIGPGETPSRNSEGGNAPAPSPAPSSARPDVKAGHEIAAELSARVTYAITGALIKDHKKATATGEEHKAIKAAFAAFYEHRGVVFVGSVALLLILVSYAVGDSRREEITAMLKQLFTKKKTAGDVIEIQARTVTPEPSTPKTSSEPQSAFGN